MLGFLAGTVTDESNETRTSGNIKVSKSFSFAVSSLFFGISLLSLGPCYLACYNSHITVISRYQTNMLIFPASCHLGPNDPRCKGVLKHFVHVDKK